MSDLSSCTVSLGARSSAATMHGTSDTMPLSPSPVRMPTTRAGNIADIRRTRLHIAVIHRREHLRELYTGVADSGLGVYTVVLNHTLDALHEIQIVQHHLVRLEQHCRVLTGLSKCLVIQLCELFLRRLPRCAESLQLCRGVAHLMARNDAAGSAVKADRACRYAFGYAFAENLLHLAHSLQVRLEKCLDLRCRFRFVLAFHFHANGVAVLDAHAHDGDQAACIRFLSPKCRKTLLLNFAASFASMPAGRA